MVLKGRFNVFIFLFLLSYINILNVYELITSNSFLSLKIGPRYQRRTLGSFNSNDNELLKKFKQLSKIDLNDEERDALMSCQYLYFFYKRFVELFNKFLDSLELLVKSRLNDGCLTKIRLLLDECDLKKNSKNKTCILIRKTGDKLLGAERGYISLISRADNLHFSLPLMEEQLVLFLSECVLEVLIPASTLNSWFKTVELTSKTMNSAVILSSHLRSTNYYCDHNFLRELEIKLKSFKRSVSFGKNSIHLIPERSKYSSSTFSSESKRRENKRKKVSVGKYKPAWR